MSVQRTFTLVPAAPTRRDASPARPDPVPGGPRVMTSKQVKKAYKDANKGPRLTRAERLAQDRAEQARIRKELEKEKAAAKAKLLRDKKKDKEAAEKEVKKKKGLPLVTVRPSQDTIARFVRGMGGGKKRDCRGDVVAQPAPAMPTVQAPRPTTLGPLAEEPEEALEEQRVSVPAVVSIDRTISAHREGHDEHPTSYMVDLGTHDTNEKEPPDSKALGYQQNPGLSPRPDEQKPSDPSDGASADLEAILGDMDEAELFEDYVPSELHERAAQQRLTQSVTSTEGGHNDKTQNDVGPESPNLRVPEPLGCRSPGMLKEGTQKCLPVNESFEDLDPDFLDDMNTLLDVDLVPLVSKSPEGAHKAVEDRQGLAHQDLQGKSGGADNAGGRNHGLAVELSPAVGHGVACQPSIESPSPRQPPPLSTQAIMLHVEDFFPTSSQQALELEEDLRVPVHSLASRSQPRPIPPATVHRHQPSIEPIPPAEEESRTPSPSPSPQPFFTSSGKRCRESFALHQQKRAAAMQALQEREQRKLRLGREQAEERVAAGRRAEPPAEAERDPLSMRSVLVAADDKRNTAVLYNQDEAITKTSHETRQDGERDGNENNSLLICSQETEYGGDWVDDLATELIL